MERTDEDQSKSNLTNPRLSHSSSTRSSKRGTPLLHRRHLNLHHRSGNTNESVDTKLMVTQTTSQVTHLSQPKEDGSGRPKSDPTSRLLTRRKQYSTNRVPTISLDDQGVSTSSPNIRTGVLSPSSSRQSFNNRSPTNTPKTIPGVTSISPLAIPRLDVNITQRALSASPSKDSPTGKFAPYQRNTFSASSMESVGARPPGVFRSNQLSMNNYLPQTFTPSSTQSPSGTSPLQFRTIFPSRLMTTTPSSPPNSGVSDNSLVQQRSTESHESSFSMPSATSSGSNGLVHSSTRIARLAFRERIITSSHESTPNTTTQRSPHFETHTIHRRSSYEIATGKLDIPQPKEKRNALKNAFHALKDKRDAFFKRSSKTMDESNELSDPVYHLLRCAATPDHQPSTCKCVCHMDVYEGNRNLAEMSSPISVLFSPRSPPQPHLPLKSKFAESKAPNSYPSLYPEEELTQRPDMYKSSEIGLSKKPTFSLPSILSRRKLFIGQKSHRPKEQGEVISPDTGSVSNQLSTRSKKQVFSFDSP